MNDKLRRSAARVRLGSVCKRPATTMNISHTVTLILTALVYQMMTCRLSSRRLGGSRGSLQAGTACSAASELDLSSRSRRSHKARLKLLGASGEAPLLGGWRSTPHTPRAPATPAPHHSHNHLAAASHCNGTDSGSRGGLRRRSTYASGRLRAGPHWSFVFDPAGRLCYYWSMVVSLAFLYNLWVIVYRFAFQEINGETLIVWFCLDYFSDFLYLADILFHFRTGYLEDGVLQTDAAKLRAHYMNSTTFYIDCLCLLPLDFLYLSIGFNSILRSFRLVKIYRFWAFMDRTERHTNYPNLFRSTSLIHYLLVIFHWNGCLYHIIYKNNGFGSKNWVYHDTESADVVKQYLQSYYWCTLALTTIGDLPRPRSKGEYVFVIAQLLFGLLLFATVLGHVANIVTSVSTARKEFQERAGGVSTTLISTAARLKRQWRRDGRAEPAESVTFLAGAAAKWVTGLNVINSSAKVGRRTAPGRQRAPRASSIRSTPRPDPNNSTIIDPLAPDATSR
ncbi:Cyclic nucleotide-gated channel rod photoreceptor subunit alpha [Papilio xuthus]|uniref:Cyclic nucleotide-gated channel rod photoreceptor subunit alpha n=1 Tax=Papilio xuthus TaxID=66420 RepID=A0A194PJ90_PAPXU|nr:Cyclic nucleotide-gated channel rod photoreceptor subunit alpha [Papilio xuthus]